jgi:pimeloyl-ACP methyl ester carboxylesterase
MAFNPMRLIRWTLTALLLAGIAGWLAYTRLDPERRRIDAVARGEAPGRFVRLAEGVTHYEVAGPDTGRVVVLAAAFSVPAFLSDSLYQRLADSGFRVIRFDYYGRGWSDRPMVVYDQDLFVRQLAGLLDSLGLREPVSLAGLSFGAAIVTSFTVRHPQRVGSLIYVDPVFNTGRPLPPEERSPLAWNVHMVLRGGSEEMAARPVIRLPPSGATSRLAGPLPGRAAVQGNPGGAPADPRGHRGGPASGGAAPAARRAPESRAGRLGASG